MTNASVMAAATPAAKAPDGEPRRGRPGGFGGRAEAVGGEIEVRREHDREQRERDRAVELRHAQVGQDQRQQRGHDGSERVEAGRGDGQRPPALQPQRRQQADGERGHDGEDHEARDVVGDAQHLGHRRRQQARRRVRRQPRPGRDGAQRDEAGQRRGCRSGGAAPGGERQDRHGDGGENRPLRVEAARAQGQHREHRQRRQCAPSRSSRALRPHRAWRDAARAR